MFRHKPRAPEPWPEGCEPAIRRSICTGEQAIGFREVKSGRFIEIALLSDEKAERAFRERYGVSGEIPVIY